MASSATSPGLSSYLVTPAQLSAALKAQPNTIVPISAAWFLPNDPQSRTGASSFARSHIPTSRFFDIDAISDPSSPYPHMLPSAASFAAHMSRLGVRATDTLVVYDAAETGLFAAPRAAWTFRAFGHRGAVHVLNNYALYVAAGHDTAAGPQGAWPETAYEAQGPDAGMVADFAAVRALAVANASRGAERRGEVVILDARSRGRWEGSAPEPREGLSSGHIPGSISVPFTDVLDPETKAMKSGDELRKFFHGLGVTGDKPIVASCGSGVTAAVLEAALLEAGIADGQRKVYDGSWTEWAQRASEDEGLIVKSK